MLASYSAISLKLRTQLDVALERKQDVIRLDVSVDDALGMQMLKTV